MVLEMLAVMMAFLGLSAVLSGRSLRVVFHSLMESGPSIALGAFWLIEIVYQVLLLRVVVMRLHDTGIRGWWGVVGVLGLAAVRVVAPEGSAAGWIVDAIALIFGLLVLFWPGTKGPNPFGSDPGIASRGQT